MAQWTNGFDDEASSSSYSMGGQNGMQQELNGKAPTWFHTYLSPSVSRRSESFRHDPQPKGWGMAWAKQRENTVLENVQEKQNALNAQLNVLLSTDLSENARSAAAISALYRARELVALLESDDFKEFISSPTNGIYGTNSMNNGHANGLGARFEHAVRTGDIATINKLAPHM